MASKKLVEEMEEEKKKQKELEKTIRKVSSRVTNAVQAEEALKADIKSSFETTAGVTYDVCGWLDLMKGQHEVAEKANERLKERLNTLL